MTAITTDTPQWQQALTRANNTRFATSAYRRHIATLSREDGSVAVAELLEGDPPADLASIPIGRLLTTIMSIGHRNLAMLLRHAGIMSAQRRVRELTPRQRLALAYALRNREVLYPFARSTRGR